MGSFKNSDDFDSFPDHDIAIWISSQDFSSQGEGTTKQKYKNFIKIIWILFYNFFHFIYELSTNKHLSQCNWASILGDVTLLMYNL